MNTQTKTEKRGKDASSRQPKRPAQPSFVMSLHGRGIVEGNPRICLKCSQPIGMDDLWTAYNSPPEPSGESYRLIVHDRCSGKNGKQ